MPINHDTSFVDNLKPSMAVMFFDRVAKNPGNEAFRYPVGEAWTVGDLEGGRRPGHQPRRGPALPRHPARAARRHRLRHALRVDPRRPGDHGAGGATTTVYPSTNAEDTAYILSDSECQVVFVEDDEQLAKLTERRSEIPTRRARSSPSTAPATATG